MPGVKVEAGNATFSGTDAMANVTLKSIRYVLAAIAITTTGKAVAVSGAGEAALSYITFTRTDATSGDTFNYLIIGY